MSWARLKSPKALLLTGFALVSIPLLLAVVTSAVKIRDLSAESANLVRSGVQGTLYSQQLIERMGSFERSVKVYSTFNSDEMARDYQRSRSRLLEILAALENVAKDAQRVQHTQGLRDALRDIDLLVPRPLSADAAVSVRTQMESMWQLALQFSKSTGEQIEAGLQRLQQSTSDAQQFLFWQSVCLTALTAVLVALFTRLSLRHLRRIENSHLPAV